MQVVKLNKPIAIGASIVDLSAKHMYSFSYVSKPKYGDTVRLAYTDTDSHIYAYFRCEDMRHAFDPLYYQENHPNFNIGNKMVLGKLKCETNGKSDI